MTQQSTITDGHEVKVENFERNLRVALSTDELATRADRAAHLLKLRDDKEADVKAASAAGKAQIKEYESEMRRIQGEVRDRATYKPVACQRQFNYRMGSVVEMRLDTHEAIHERPMSAEERQLKLGVDDERETEPPPPNGESPEPELATSTAAKPRRGRRKSKAAH
jgi:hypothetical protein